MAMMQRMRGMAVCAVLALAAGWSGVAAGAELLPGLQVRDNGYMELDGIRMDVTAWDMKWGYVKQDALRREQGFPVEKAGTYQVKGTLPVKAGGELAFEQLLKQEGEGLSYVASVKSADGVELRVLALCLELPIEAFAGKAIRAGDKEITLPAEFKSQDVASMKDVPSLAIPLTKGTLTLKGKYGIYIQDQRQFKGKSFSVRVFFTPQGGLITDAKLELSIAIAK